MLDLAVLLSEVDLAVTAKPVLKARQSINKLTAPVRTSAAEPSPARLSSCTSKITCETGGGFFQRPNALHSDFPIFVSNLCRLISISALSSA